MIMDHDHGASGGVTTGDQGQATNTDREIWRESEGDFYGDSIHVTRSGAIGINCGGFVKVRPLREWFGTPPREITDEMCEAAIEAMAPDRIQGFSTPGPDRRTWGAPHYIRDVWRPPGEQEIWRGDDPEEMHERCKIERMRLALRAAITSKPSTTIADEIEGIRSDLRELIAAPKER